MPEDIFASLKTALAVTLIVLILFLLATLGAKMEKPRPLPPPEPIPVYNEIPEPEPSIPEKKPEEPSPLEPPPVIDFYDMEWNIYELVNEERASRGLDAVEWNGDLAAVARRHSENLAIENEPLTEFNLSCPRPFIHHEGLDFGLYHYDRLHNSSIHYFTLSGENIFITSSWASLETYLDEYPEPCPEEEGIIYPYEGDDAEGQVLRDLQERLDYVEGVKRINWTYIEWMSQDELEELTVQSWLESPGHKEVMLDPGFNETGVGVAEVNDFYIVTQIYIQRVGCGYETGPCCEEEGYYPYCYEPMECMEGMCYS